jgi:glycosyltransferase involved in cell wall biosynthesis
MSVGSTQGGPLVSIMMPAYNAGKTIKFGLASLLAQSYKNWECIVVDDGSVDDTYQIASSINDPRIRIIRFETNKGRGAARQRALEEAKGIFIGMLDADDWIYPQKLVKQVEILTDNPDISLVSCGMSIVDKNNMLQGIRCKGNCIAFKFTKPGKVPVAHAPSIYRLKDVMDLQYDQRFKLAQDVDFLRRFLLGKNYLILNEALYSYTEMESAKLNKVIKAYFYNIIGLKKFIRTYPMFISLQIADQFSKMIVQVSLGALGLFSILLKKRSKNPAQNELVAFTRAKEEVSKILAKM